MKRGRISYRLSEPATVRLVLARRVHRHLKRIGRVFSGRGASGANQVALPHARSLRPGAYRLTVTATDAAGNRSARGVRFLVAD